MCVSLLVKEGKGWPAFAGFIWAGKVPPRDNNDGIVLALAPARSARGIREALIS
jgi:hypothetical protein